MNCTQVERLIAAYADGEVDVVQRRSIGQPPRGTVAACDEATRRRSSCASGFGAEVP